MNKILLLTIAAIQVSFAQNTFPTSGNVGIGTLNPITTLDINGIIQLYNKDHQSATWDNIRIWSEGENSFIESSGDEKGLIIKSNTGNKILLMGNVGIGTTNPSNKLDVSGTIHSKEVKVDMAGWSDFVFKKEYKLPTLEDVEKHITEKRHLENIPSEEEVLENGINLGEMNAKLLQKIEELTLHLIEKNKQINFLLKENTMMKKNNDEFKKMFLTRLENLENK